MSPVDVRALRAPADPPAVIAFRRLHEATDRSELRAIIEAQRGHLDW